MNFGILFGCLGFVFLIIAIIFGVRYFRKKRSENGSSTGDRTVVYTAVNSEERPNGGGISWTSSGSGLGNPLLISRTVSREIKVGDKIGSGKNGEVYKGIWRGEFVAVKKFSTRDEQSWRRESEIYQTTMLRHDNILGFIATDNKDVGIWTELWLVTEYHQNGSLFDFLTNNSINIGESLKFASSIVAGVCHLHMPVAGTRGKPRIAHRDIKSKNILVKSNGECCVADLGLAVSYNDQDDSVNIAENHRVGTKRYMSPELLEGVMNMKQFDNFVKSDVYSLALVLWEIFNRVQINDTPALEYKMPYEDSVNSDPEISEMKNIVCDLKMRPGNNDWPQNAVLESVWKLIEECWSAKPSARLTALRIKKNFAKIQEKIGENSSSVEEVA